MVNHHNLIDGIFNALKNLRHVDTTKCTVRNDSMLPSYSKGEVVEVDQTKPALHGSIVAIRNAEGVELREVMICKGTLYLVPHNRVFPKAALGDYLALDPEAYFVGVVR